MTAQFVRVCSEQEIEEGKTKAVLVEDQPVILAKKDGAVYALQGICSHDGGIFQADEKLVDKQIECPRHGARFNIQTGDATRMPAIVGIPVYEVKIENGDVYVGIEE